MNFKNIEELITGYVDGELSEAEEQALMQKARNDERIYKSIEAERRLKQMLKSRLQQTKAPESLRHNISELLLSEGRRGTRENTDSTAYGDIKSDQPSGNQNRFLLSFAAIISVGLLLAFAMRFIGTVDSSSVPANAAAKDVELVSQLHYADRSGQQPSESFEAHSVSEVQQMLRERYDVDITVPELNGARFAGITYADFYDGFHAPLLTYEVEPGDFIYIFAFQNKDLASQNQLAVNAEARQAIVAHDDVFIHNVDGHDVVSWQWHDVWYTAVSGHDGEIVASMLPH